MRIIDADALHINIIGGRMNGKIEFADAVKAMINDAPTVDAIPVSWIKENKNLARTVGAWQYELFLDTLLKDWEEENG